MATPLRWYRPDRIYELTTRTIQERFLLRPSRSSRDLVLGVIARGLTLYPCVRIHAFVFLSNHYHMLASTTDGGSLPRFLDYLNGNVARELGRLHGWDGRFWQRRARVIEVVDDDAIIGRLRYIISQGLKEGLIGRATEWSGASAVPALIGAAPLQGIWVNRDLETRAARRGRSLPPDQRQTVLPVPLAPIPPWAHLAPDALMARHRALVAEVELEAARARSGPPLGIRWVEAQNPHERPEQSKRDPAPLCHASTGKTRSIFRAAYHAFVAAFRRAADDLRTSSHVLFPAFPPGSCPRPPTYVPANVFPPTSPTPSG